MPKGKNGADNGVKKKRNGKDAEEEKTPRPGLHPETKKSVLAVIFFLFAAILTMAYFGYAGRAGEYLYRAFDALLGVGFFLVPVSLVMVGIGFLRSLKTDLYLSSVLGGTLFLLGFLGLIDIVGNQWGGVTGHAAGYIGFAVSYPFLYLFNFWVTLLIFVAVIFIAASVAFNIPLFRKKEKPEEAMALAEAEEEDIETEEEEEDDTAEEAEEDDRFSVRALSQMKEKAKEAFAGAIAKKEEKQETPSQSRKAAEFIIETHQKSYKIPPVDLLEKDTGKPSSGDIEAYAQVIQRTLKHFGIEVEMGEVNVGPTVTQYTLKPAQGVKLSRIVALSNDLSLALAAHPLRIEAPIPGRSLVGIEIPNKAVAIVRLRALIENPAFKESAPLAVALGKDVAGNSQYMDIEKMPHLLVAGSTGSGKSVCLHTILTSLLYKNFPQMVKFIIIDPKRIELAAYNGIPHLLAPIITDRDKAVAALRWAVREMERRYEYLAQYKVRNIGSYNAQVAGGSGEARIMPYIVIVIDELADLMMAAAKEAEAAIVRLAQMSRAVGIHLIISTQRPSVEVITGLIKANIPCRLAFQVASLVDSRTILDMSGAEKLLGNGDMLFLPPDAAKPRRIQGGFVSEKEVKRITDFIREIAEDAFVPGESEPAAQSIAEALEKPKQGALLSLNGGGDEGSDEEMLVQAREVVARAQKASASLLQRRLKLGYSRAARIIDMLEEEGAIGPQDGSRPREVYLSKPGDASDDADED